MDYSGIIIERKDGRMLFQLRTGDDKLYPNNWCTFGGGRRKNETPMMTLKREIREELNFKIDEEKVKKILRFWTPWKTYNIYYIKLNTNKPRMKLGEGQDMAYFSRRELLKKKNVVFVVRMLMLFYPLIKKF